MCVAFDALHKILLILAYSWVIWVDSLLILYYISRSIAFFTNSEFFLRNKPFVYTFKIDTSSCAHDRRQHVQTKMTSVPLEMTSHSQFPLNRRTRLKLFLPSDNSDFHVGNQLSIPVFECDICSCAHGRRQHVKTKLTSVPLKMTPQSQFPLNKNSPTLVNQISILNLDNDIPSCAHVRREHVKLKMTSLPLQITSV